VDLDFRKLIAAGAIAGVLGFGGAAIAGAQEAPDDSTTTTEAPTTTDEAPTDREGCDKDGDGVPDDHQSEADAS
jgi:hypothetical protein